MTFYLEQKCSSLSHYCNHGNHHWLFLLMACLNCLDLSELDMFHVHHVLCGSKIVSSVCLFFHQQWPRSATGAFWCFSCILNLIVL